MVPAVYKIIINHSKIAIIGDRPVFIVQIVEAVINRDGELCRHY